MPVGNPNDGIGLLSGQLMISNSAFFQDISWYHDPVPSEEFWEHKGTFNSYILQPTFSLGITNDINISISQIIGFRTMGFTPNYIGPGSTPNNFTSNHHRDENSTSKFNNAVGGLLGDLTIMGKFILYYTDSSEGFRLFLNSGFSIPSKNALSSDPYFQKLIDIEYGNADGKVDEDETVNFNQSDQIDKAHKHFAISDGVYRFIIKPSIFYKKFTNPVFIGLSLKYSTQMASRYSFETSDSYEINFSSLFSSSKMPLIKDFVSKNINFSLGLMATYMGESSWDGYKSPVSKQLIFRPSFGLLYNTKSYGTFNLLINSPYYVEGFFQDSNEYQDPDFEQSSKELSIILNYRIPMNFYLW